MCIRDRHSFAGAIADYVIDNLTGLGIFIINIKNGTIYNQSNDTAKGQSWSDWLSYINGLTMSSFSDLRAPTMAEALSTPLVNRNLNGFQTYGKYFLKTHQDDYIANNGINRISIGTSESVNVSDFMAISDSANNEISSVNTKSVSAGFTERIVRYYAIRTHF